MKVKNLLGMLFVASLAMTSCSNDDITENGLDSGKTEIPGQKTWAMLNFGIQEAISRAVGGNGTEAGTAEEKSVKTVHLYIFDESDQLELSMNVDKKDLTSGDFDGKFLAPAAAVEVTSGKKTFCVILNQYGTVSADKGTPLATFKKQVQTISNYAGLLGGGMMDNSENLMMSGITGNITLHAGISKTDAENAANSSETKDDGANNVVSLFVNRNVAKLDLKLKADATTLDVKADAEKLATLQGVKYQVNNLSTQAYYFLQDIDANQVYPTPFYTESIHTADWGTKWINQETGFSELKSTLYLTPNTHEQNKAKVGNTTYTLVRGVYVPVSGDGKYVVTGYSNTTKKFTYSTQPLTGGANAKSLFSYDYSVAFTSLTLSSMDLQTNLSTVTLQLQALVARRVAEKYAAESDIATSDVKFLADAAAYATLDKTTESKVYAYLVPATYTEGGVAKNKAGRYTIEMKRWSKKLGETAATEDKSFNLAPLTVGVYNVVGDNTTFGLECFYRVNTFTAEYDKAHPMYYSVVRNYSYHVTINSVTQIGDTASDNVDLPGKEEQDKPIEEATTFMQCSISIYKWVASDMNVDLGK